MTKIDQNLNIWVRRLQNFSERYPNLVAFFILGAIIFVSGYWHIASIGLYGDDFGASTFLFNSSVKDAVMDWWRAGSGEILNFRILAVILPIAWFYIFKVFGLVGVIFFNYLVYLSLVWLFFLILRKVLSKELALFGAILFALYPTNNAYLWQVTMSYSLALVGVFLAVYFFQNKRWFFSVLFLAVSALVNEGVFCIYFLALLPKTGEVFSWQNFKPNFKKWLAIFFGVLIIYAGARTGIEMLGVTGGSRTTYVLEHFSLFSYIAQFIKSFAVVLVISFAAVLWKMHKAFEWWNLFVGGFVFFLSYIFLRSSLEDFSQNNNRENIFKLSFPSIIMIMGLMLIVAGRYYGFYFVPSINVLNLDSRYYFAASVGGVVFFTGFLQFLLLKFQKRAKVLVLFSCLVISILAIFRFQVHNDYAKSFSESRLLWTRLLEGIPILPENSLVVVNIPDKTLGKPVSLFEALGDLRVLSPRLYNKNVTFVSRPFVQNLELTENTSCLDSPPFFENKCFEKNLLFIFDWKDQKLVQVLGTPVQTIKEGAALKASENFRKVILP